MLDKKGVGRRMVVAHIQLMSQIGVRVTFVDLADRVTRAHGTRQFTAGQVSEYQKASVMPPIEVVWAYAKATGVDPGWLAFGSESSAEAPPGVASSYPAEILPASPSQPLPRHKAAKKRKRA
jgi:transcriptional regulator with XRE-family HTH domain